MVDHVEVLVEEPSMEAALRALLPAMLGETSFEVYNYRSKAQLLARLPERLRGYQAWLPANWRVVVVLDRDDDDCHSLKRRLNAMADDAGLVTRSRGVRSYAVANRLAIEELEAWYFGDWAAVRAAYPRASVNVPSKAAYRDPDAIRGGTWEAFEREMQTAGYFRGGLQKIEAARSIAPHMDHARNTSRSFGAFRDVMVEISAQ